MSKTNDIINTSGIFRHYLFDIEMFTQINLLTAVSFTTGEIVTGSNSGATGVVQSISVTGTFTPTDISVANPGVATLANHGFRDGQQVTLSGGNFEIGGAAYTPGVYSIRNATQNTFELFSADGTTAQNVTAFTSGPNIEHALAVLSNVKGTFATGETITGQTSSTSAVIQADVNGRKGILSSDISSAADLINSS